MSEVISFEEAKAEIIKKHRHISKAARSYGLAREHLSRVLGRKDSMTPFVRQKIEEDLGKKLASQ